MRTRRKEKRSVVHFFHKDFRRCKIMDGHLEVRAQPEALCAPHRYL